MKAPLDTRLRSLVAFAFALMLWTPTRAAETASAEPPASYYADYYLNGVNVISGLTQQDVMATPDWSWAEPLPISVSNAVEIAMAQLSRAEELFPPLKKSAGPWTMRGLEIRPFQRIVNPLAAPPKKWFFFITFERVGAPQKENGVRVLVDFSGKPGEIRALHSTDKRKISDSRVLPGNP